MLASRKSHVATKVVVTCIECSCVEQLATVRFLASDPSCLVASMYIFILSAHYARPLGLPEHVISRQQAGTLLVCPA